MIYRFKPLNQKSVKTGHLNMGGTSPDGRVIGVNSLSFTKDGKPFIGVMGEYHFARDKRENWYEELCKMRAGGVGIVSTYLFWIYHEEIEGEFDFSGDRDIRRFVEDAARAGLDVFLRIGPWAHGECRNGGFPDWLVGKGIPLRRDDERYLSYVRRFYARIAAEVRGLLFSEGGNIIGIQLENELTDGAEHLHTLKKLAVEVGLKAPLYTVTGWNSAYGAKIPLREVVPVFGAYADAPWHGGSEKLPPSPHYVFDPQRNDAAIGFDILKAPPKDGYMLPYEDYPFATCELGAGLHPTHLRRYIFKPMDAYAMSLCKLGSGNNLIGYYMYHGGENKIGKLSTFEENKKTGYPNDYPILNYDYQTCLGQYGQARGQYGLLNLLHLFAEDFGEGLAKMEYAPSEQAVSASDFESARYALRSDGEDGYVFVNHYQRGAKLRNIFGARFRPREDILFPEIDIVGGVAFFMPYNLRLGAQKLLWATAQPVCRDGNTYFFARIDGVRPVYRFEDAELSPNAGLDGTVRHGDIRIVTLPFDRARYLRRLNGKLYLGDGADVYEAGGEIKCIQGGAFGYSVWDGERFVPHTGGESFRPAKLTLTDCELPFESKYMYELRLPGAGEIRCKKLSVDSDKGFVEIDLPCDCAQIYRDKKLVADWFWCGIPQQIPAQLLCGGECYLFWSEPGEGIYTEMGL